MKLALLIGLSLLAVTIAMPAASAEVAEPCDYDGSVLNRVQECGNALVDRAQQKAEEVFCDLVCDM